MSNLYMTKRQGWFSPETAHIELGIERVHKYDTFNNVCEFKNKNESVLVVVFLVDVAWSLIKIILD